MATGDNYIFATGEAAAPRLLLLEKVYGSSTSALLREAGVRPGLRVVEVGCGVGFTTCQLARTVGPSGRVTAIDISGDQLALAASNARSNGLTNIDFIEASATSTGLPSESADLVFARLLLSHIREVGNTLAEFRRLLKVEGLLACEDLIASQIYSSPDTRVYSELRKMSTQFSARQGVDYSIGIRLPNLIRSACLDVHSVRMVQPAFYSGEEKRWWEFTVREASPMLLKTEFLDQTRLEELLKALEAVAIDDDCLVAQPTMTQVVARRGRL